MRYMKVDWHHNFPDEPITAYYEVDEDRYPLRQLEIFRDGRIGYAFYADDTLSNIIEFGGTMLGDQPIPEIDEINDNPELYAAAISKDAFESLWGQFVKYAK